MSSNSTTKIIEWQNCYRGSWKGLIHEDAFQHPAKFAQGLVFRIVEYALEMGYIETDSKILDPFGGVGLGSLPSTNNGLIWLGNELEDKFYLDAYKNFALWCERFWCVCDDPEYLALLRQYATPTLEESPQLALFAQDEANPDDLLEQIKAHALASWDKPNKGAWCEVCGKVIVAYPVLLKGDSRLLSTIIHQQVDGSISSPPFMDGTAHDPRPNKTTEAYLAKYGSKNLHGEYGTSGNQLGNLPPGDLDSIVSSPPYIDTDVGGRGGEGSMAVGDATRRARIKAGNSSENAAKAIGVGYGTEDGQLGSLPAGNFDSLISSPPYANTLDSEKSGVDPGKFKDPYGKTTQALRPTQYGKEDGQLGSLPEGSLDALVSSSPFADSIGSDDPDKRGGLYADPKRRNDKNLTSTYGSGDGQLANLPDKGFDLSVSSPSFAGNTGGRGDASRNGIDPALFDRSSGGMKRGTGESEDNLDHLPMKGFDSAVSSPPYEGLDLGGGAGILKRDKQLQKSYTLEDGNYSVKGSNNNQLGNSTGSTFWSAAREILGQCWLLLKPGAYSFWVVKMYVKGGKLVDFPGQWLKLCEVCGFEHIETIIAWQTEDKGTNFDFEGEKQKKVVRRQSFFRLLHIKNHPELAIDSEIVLVMRKL